MFEGAQSAEIPKELRLRSLGLHAMVVEEAALFSILASCPNLRELRLTALKHSRIIRPTANLGQVHLVTFTGAFFRRLAAVCPRINCLDITTMYSLHSYGFQGLTKEALEEALALFPCLAETTLVGDDACPKIFETLDSYLRNTLTTLEITGAARTNVGNYLHAYLCDSPHLLHLKAPYVDVPNSCFDLEGILRGGRYIYQRKLAGSHDVEIVVVTGARASTYGRSKKRKIWACRNLRTLDLRCHRDDDADAEENSRMIFSYLSKVCPQLEHLTIRRSPLMKRDLKWIKKYMTLIQKLKMVAFLLPSRHSRFSQIESATPFRNTLSSSRKDDVFPVTGIGYPSNARNVQETGVDHIVDGVDMRHVGRVEDVIEHAAKRFTDSACCWPQLEFLQVSSQESCTFPHQRSVVKWIKVYRPAVEVVWGSSSE
ncbi:hypothetical protein EC968_005072 [Mortierella alpina]|nr:hypothetical protein EC968_005072 [Mortierella alpina]